MAEAKTTTDHKKIQQWVEKRGGKPACVRGTGGKGDTGLLRIDFPGYSGEDSLQEIEWDEFFEKFEDQNLAFLYQEKTAGGKPSNFTKFVARDAAGGRGRGSAGAGKKKAAVKGTKTAKSAARKKSAGGGMSSGGKKAAKKAPKKSGGTMKKGVKKAAKKSGGRKKAAR